LTSGEKKNPPHHSQKWMERGGNLPRGLAGRGGGGKRIRRSGVKKGSGWSSGIIGLGPKEGEREEGGRGRREVVSKDDDKGGGSLKRGNIKTKNRIHGKR